MIDFCMKRMAGILLSRLQATARKVVEDPVKNVHARRMREDVRFYRDWLLPRFRLHCDESNWQMPEVGAFEIDLEAEGMGWMMDDAHNAVEDDDDRSAEIRLDGTRQRQQQQCRAEEDASRLGDDSSHYGCGSTSSRSSAKSHNFLKNLVRKKETQEEKIAAARRRAAERMRPRPFSESKAHRLKELKMAKMKAEERRHARCLDSGSSSADSIASYSTLQTLQELDAEEGEAKRYVSIFGCGLLAHTVLLVLRRFGFLNIAKCTSQTLRNSPDFIMICLQSMTLWALLNGVKLILARRDS